MFCPNCGAQIREGHPFCGGCGAPVAQVANTQTPPQPYVAPQPVYQPYQPVSGGSQPVPQPIQQNKSEKKIKPWMYIVGAGVILSIVLLIYFLNSDDKDDRYREKRYKVDLKGDEVIYRFDNYDGLYCIK